MKSSRSLVWYPHAYLQAKAQAHSAAIAHLAELLNRYDLITAWSYTTVDAIFDTEQMLMMTNYIKTSYLASSQDTLLEYAKEPDYPRQYTRWMILNAAEQCLLHFDKEHTDHVTELAQNLIHMVPTEEFHKNTCLRHTFKLDNTSWLHNKTFVITGELHDVDRESLTTLLEGCGAIVHGHVSRFTDFVIAGSYLRDGRSIVEGSKYRRMVELNTRREHPHMWIQLLHEPQMKSILPEQDWKHACDVTAERKRREECKEIRTAAQTLCGFQQASQSKTRSSKQSNGFHATKHVRIDPPHVDDDCTKSRPVTRSMTKRRRLA